MVKSIIVGVDEVGRGCLAGPVVAAAVAFPIGQKKIFGVDDSKQLSAHQRERLDALIRQSATCIGIGRVEAMEIDQIGIVAAVAKAMRYACASFPSINQILVDGPSTLGLELVCPQVTAIVHGDHLDYSIGAASIVAKVYRDQLMRELALVYPNYLWDQNKGYGTTMHFKGLIQHGLCPHHRRTFIHLLQRG